MIIEKVYISKHAKELIKHNSFATDAYSEITNSISSNHTPGLSSFYINNCNKNGNGVVPIKDGIYRKLEVDYSWYREKAIPYLRDEAKKGGPIDVYKQFGPDPFFKVGLEFETGNISSAHRSINKLCLGLKTGSLDMAILIMPIKQLAYYLTDRVSNYEEIEPYLQLLDDYPFVVLGFDADVYDSKTPLLPKGRDGMSVRAIHKWKD